MLLNNSKIKLKIVKINRENRRELDLSLIIMFKSNKIYKKYQIKKIRILLIYLIIKVSIYRKRVFLK